MTFNHHWACNGFHVARWRHLAAILALGESGQKGGNVALRLLPRGVIICSTVWLSYFAASANAFQCFLCCYCFYFFPILLQLQTFELWTRGGATGGRRGAAAPPTKNYGHLLTSQFLSQLVFLLTEIRKSSIHASSSFGKITKHSF